MVNGIFLSKTMGILIQKSHKSLGREKIRNASPHIIVLVMRNDLKISLDMQNSSSMTATKFERNMSRHLEIIRKNKLGAI